MTAETLLLRQIHPTHVQGSVVSVQAFTEVISSSAFIPTKNDEGKLSVYNEEKFTAEKAYEHFTDTMKRQSAGVLGVSCAECAAQSLPFAEDNDPFDGHAHIDYNGLSKGQIKAKASNLRDAAKGRGWLYQP